VYVAAYAGLRWGELAGLRVERVDLLRRTVSVVEQLTEVNGRVAFGPPKTAAARRAVNVPVGVAELLHDQLDRRASGGLVFPTREGGPMRRSHFRRRAWLAARARAGLDGLRFHDLRHSAVALAIAQGAHPKAIQERMGHSSVTLTLDRYGHLFPALDERIAEGLDAVYRSAAAGFSRDGDGTKVASIAR
jgi:integrase